jgi:hypothetical protein
MLSTGEKMQIAIKEIINNDSIRALLITRYLPEIIIIKNTIKLIKKQPQ